MKSLPWFRMYHEAIDDEKLRLLACEDRWHFVALLCCKAKGILDEGGTLMRRKVAVKLGLSTNELDEVARRLDEVGLIDGATLQPLAWGSRQAQSDKDETNAQRQQRFREAHKKPITDGNALRNAPVTRIDIEEDIEEEEEERGRQPAVATRATRKCPPSFEISQGLIAWALQNTPSVDTISATSKFRDHTFRTAISDWDGAWRNWMRKDQEYAISKQSRSYSKQSAQAKTINELTGGLASVKEHQNALAIA